jgi:hypothetical protein
MQPTPPPDTQTLTSQRPNTTCVAVDGNKTRSFVSTSSLKQKEKLILAIKRLGVFWGIALLFIPIPAVHFVAVPGFIVIGIVALIRTLSLKSLRTSAASLTCPNCHSELTMQPRFYRSPFKELCPTCRHSFHVEIDAGEF